MAGWCTLHDQPPSAPPWLSPGRWTYSATSRRRGRRRRALRGAAGQPASLTSSSCPRCGGGGGATCHSLGGGRIAMCAPACDMCPPPACMQDLMFLWGAGACISLSVASPCLPTPTCLPPCLPASVQDLMFLLDPACLPPAPPLPPPPLPVCRISCSWGTLRWPRCVPSRRPSG